MGEEAVIVPVVKRAPPVGDERAIATWATNLAREEAKRCVEILVDVLKPKLKAQKDRIKALEQRLDELEGKLAFANELQKELGRRTGGGPIKHFDDQNGHRGPPEKSAPSS